MNQILPWWIFYEICFCNLFHISEAGWSWNRPHHHPHQHHHHHNHHRASSQGKGCVRGYCTKRWECPEHSVALEPTGACAYLRRDAGWVCCYKDVPDGPQNQWTDGYSGRSRGGKGHGINNHNHHPAIYTLQPTSWWQSYSSSSSPVEEDNEIDPPNRGPRKHWKTNEGKHWKHNDGRNWKGNEDKHWKSKMTPRTTEWIEVPPTEPYRPEVPRKRTTAWFKPNARTKKVFWPDIPRVPKVTTSVPNINERICGYREVAPVLSRLEEYKEFVETAKKFTDAKKIPFQIDAIVGGEEAEPYSWPWVAALYRETETGRRRFLSAGSLINTNFILTAAHVFKSQDIRSPSFMVFLGTHTTDDAIAVYRVRSVLQHPEYQARYYYHDIALLRLQSPVLFNDYVMPVCLPSPSSRLVSDDLTGRDVTVTGWGDQSFGGVSSRVLKEATFPVVSREACNASYIGVASSRFPRGITKEMLCAGDPGGGKDACQGDSGGPLMIRNDNRYTQVGIVSFGYQCGDKDYPGVYTKVSPYLKWINQNTEGVEDYYVD